MLLAVKFKVAPSHKGPLLEATGVAGGLLITTSVVPGKLLQPLTVATTEKVPASANVTLFNEGF